MKLTKKVIIKLKAIGVIKYKEWENSYYYKGQLISNAHKEEKGPLQIRTQPLHKRCYTSKYSNHTRLWDDEDDMLLDTLKRAVVIGDVEL